MGSVPYIISTTDYEGRPTVLTNRCFQAHVSKWGDSDKDTRLKFVPRLARVIENPRVVIADPGHVGRNRYIDLVWDAEVSDHLLTMVVVVDFTPSPQEIVTWMIKRRLSDEIITGGVIYDSSRCDQCQDEL